MHLVHSLTPCWFNMNLSHINRYISSSFRDKLRRTLKISRRFCRLCNYHFRVHVVHSLTPFLFNFNLILSFNIFSRIPSGVLTHTSFRFSFSRAIISSFHACLRRSIHASFLIWLYCPYLMNGTDYDAPYFAVSFSPLSLPPFNPKYSP